MNGAAIRKLAEFGIRRTETCKCFAAMLANRRRYNSGSKTVSRMIGTSNIPWRFDMRVRKPIGDRIDRIAEDFIRVKALDPLVRRTCLHEVDKHGAEFLCILFAMLRVDVARIVKQLRLIRRPTQTREMPFLHDGKDHPAVTFSRARVPSSSKKYSACHGFRQYVAPFVRRYSGRYCGPSRASSGSLLKMSAL